MRIVAAGAAIVLVPAALGAIVSRAILVLAVLDTAILAVATAYAVYLGVYRYPR